MINSSIECKHEAEMRSKNNLLLINSPTCKSYLLAFFFTILAGPLGFFYTSAISGILMTALSFGSYSFMTATQILFLWPLFPLLGLLNCLIFNRKAARLKLNLSESFYHIEQ